MAGAEIFYTTHCSPMSGKSACSMDKALIAMAFVMLGVSAGMTFTQAPVPVVYVYSPAPLDEDTHRTHKAAARDYNARMMD